MTAVAGAVVAALAVSAMLALGVGAQPVVSCTIETTPVAFGGYDVFAPAPTDSTGTITYRCSRGNLSITIALGTGGGGTFTPRRMVRGGEGLAYNFYLDASRTVIWGDGSGGTSVHQNPATPAAPTGVTIFGRIPAQQDVSAGSYADMVTATINF